MWPAIYYLPLRMVIFDCTTASAIHRPKKSNYWFCDSTLCLFAIAFFFFPKERILDKAAMTKYRIDVLTMPVDKAITGAYEEGKTYEPVIRAAQNQWFINTFIHEENNPRFSLRDFICCRMHRKTREQNIMHRQLIW